MKNIQRLLAAAIVLSMVVFLMGFDTREEARITTLEVRVAALETNQTVNAAALKIWTLKELEALELREMDKRYELSTNLQALIFQTARIVLDASKSPGRPALEK